MAICTYSLTITLNVYKLISPSKRQKVAEGIRNKTLLDVAYKTLTSNLKTKTENEEMKKGMSCKWK